MGRNSSSTASALGTPTFPALVLPLALLLTAGTLSATQVRVPEGTLVRLELVYDLTTENVDKGDRVEFDVSLDVVVDGHVVIPKGAAGWAQVSKVKGAGKKKAKDALVAFQFVAVRTADNQEIPLRLLPSKPKKLDSKENEVQISTPIPGLRERMIGAPKGREFAAYTNADALVNLPDKPPAPQASAQGAPAGGVTQGSAPAAPALPAANLLPPEEAYVDCNSDPPGADIMVDGTFRGNTPSGLRLAPGRHVIELRLPGRQPWVRNMVVDPGSKPSIRAVLEAK
jgi:hypothetical protein